MAWPRCPHCHQPVPLYDRCADVRPAESEVYRSYRCACGWEALTVERVYCVDPVSLSIRRKYADEGQPAVQTPSTAVR